MLLKSITLPSSRIKLICKRISLALQPVLYCPVSGGGGFIKYIGEEYQVAKRRRKCHGCGEEYNLEKREKGRNIILPIVFKLLGRISSGEEGKRTEMLGKKIKILPPFDKNYRLLFPALLLLFDDVSGW